jgi:hypothetical protein
MAKKIYDIKPPRIKKDNQYDAVNFESVRKKKTGQSVGTSVPQEYKEKSVFSYSRILVGCAVIVFLITVYVYRGLPWVSIQIMPEMNNISMKEKVSVDASKNIIDYASKIIPAKVLTEEKEISQEFLATGTASNSGKSTGTIRVYNKISPTKSMALVAGTRFLSDSGKLFVTLQKITIPAMQGKTAGFVDVDVQAREVGSDYNIGASKFSVPGLSGSEYYYVIWGESSSSMEGGYSGSVKKVTSDDIETAKSMLTEKASKAVKDSLMGKITLQEVMIGDEINVTILQSTLDVKANSIADKFNVSMKSKASVMVVKKEDLQSFVTEALESQLSRGQLILEDNISIDYTPDSIDIKNGKAKINLQANSQSYFDINKNDIINNISGKSSEAIKDAIYQIADGKISDIKIDFWPFWVSKAPNRKNRIEVDLFFR